MAATALKTDLALRSFAVALFLNAPLACLATLTTHSLPAGFAVWALCGMAWTRPQWVLLGLVATAPIVRSWDSLLLPPPLLVTIKCAAALLLGIVFLARFAVSREATAFPRWILITLALWAALSFFATVHAADLPLALHYLCLSAAGFVAFTVAYHLAPQERKRLLWITLAVGTILAGLVLLQYAIVVFHVATFLGRFVVEPRTQAYFSSNLVPTATGHYRPSGTMSHPNAMGLYFALLIPFAMALLPVRSLHRLTRMMLTVALLLMTCALYATDSRAAALCLLAALAYLSWHVGYRWMLGAGVAGLIAVLAILAVSSSARRTLDEAWVSRARLEYGLSGRPEIWKNTFDMASQAPFLGTGPGNFSHQYVSRYGFFAPNDVSELNGQLWAVQTLGDQAIDNFHAHNIYLQLLGEVGIFGPLLLLFSFGGVLRHCEKAGRSHPLASWRRAVALALAADAVGLAAYGMFDSQLVFTIGSLNLLAGPILALGLQPLIQSISWMAKPKFVNRQPDVNQNILNVA